MKSIKSSIECSGGSEEKEENVIVIERIKDKDLFKWDQNKSRNDWKLNNYSKDKASTNPNTSYFSSGRISSRVRSDELNNLKVDWIFLQS